MITLQNIIKTYKTKEIQTYALNGFNLHINKGEFVSIMGASGCGKSTLLNILGLIEKPDSGSYVFLDKEVTKYNESKLINVRKENMGFVFQNYNLIEELNVFQNIELPLKYIGIKKSERETMVNEIMKKLNIEHRAKHYSYQLSGGQQQRVAIARAIVHKPSLILLDEPTGNLDSKNKEEVLNLLTKLNIEGTTIVMVTHSHEDAAYSKRIIEILDGISINEIINKK